jgi:protein SCO1/2
MPCFRFLIGERRDMQLRTLGMLFALTGLWVVAGCRHGKVTPNTPAPVAAGAAKTYRVTGVVRAINPDRTSVRIKHDEIRGYMAAMTMPFDVRDARELDGVKPGDKVAFRLCVTETDGWIDQLTVVEPGEPDDPKPKVEAVRVTRVVEELAEGDLLPDYSFVNEQREAVTLAQFKGQALGLTFIYTRCPYPTFCPRQSTQFAAVCKELKTLANGPTNWHLLSISFDPAHDTPAVLRNYARRYQYDPDRWSFLTGEMIDLDAITEQFGMFFSRDGEGFSHNVRTVVVDATGRIQRIYVGNQWTAEELVVEMVKAARADGAAR